MELEQQCRAAVAGFEQLSEEIEAETERLNSTDPPLLEDVLLRDAPLDHEGSALMKQIRQLTDHLLKTRHRLVAIKVEIDVLLQAMNNSPMAERLEAQRATFEKQVRTIMPHNSLHN